MPAHPTIALCLLCCGLVAGGCDGPAPAMGTLELGTGEVTFEPLLDGDDVELIYGPQGGYHIWLAFRIEGLDEGLVTLSVTMQDADEAMDEQKSTVRIQMAAGDDGTIERTGWPAILARPECYVDKPVHVTVSIEDEAGHRAEAERTAVPRFEEPLDPCMPGA